MTAENCDTFFASPHNFKESIRIISRALFGTKFYLIKVVLFCSNFNVFLPDTISKKILLNKIFILILILFLHHTLESLFIYRLWTPTFRYSQRLNTPFLYSHRLGAMISWDDFFYLFLFFELCNSYISFRCVPLLHVLCK